MLTWCNSAGFNRGNWPQLVGRKQMFLPSLFCSLSKWIALLTILSRLCCLHPRMSLFKQVAISPPTVSHCSPSTRQVWKWKMGGVKTMALTHEISTETVQPGWKEIQFWMTLSVFLFTQVVPRWLLDTYPPQDKTPNLRNHPSWWFLLSNVTIWHLRRSIHPTTKNYSI